MVAVINSKLMNDLVRKRSTIVIRLPNWVGDIVMVTPSLRNLKNTYPDKQFIATGRANCFDVLRSNQIFDDFVIKPSKQAGMGAYLNYIQELHRYNHAASLLYTNSFSTAWDFFLARFPIRMGYKNEMREFVLTHSLVKEKVAMDQYYAKLTKAFGGEITAKNLEINFDEQSIRIFNIVEKKYQIKPDDIIIGLNPGAGFGETRKWLKHHFVALAKLIDHSFPNIKFFIFGGPGDEERADFISKEIGDKAINLSRESLGLHNIKPFFDRMQLFVTGDSGLRWYSLSMNKPTIVLFGSSDPNLTHCFLDNFYPVRNKVHCSPCKNRICPTDFACMKDLMPDKVLNLIKELKNKHVW